MCSSDLFPSHDKIQKEMEEIDSRIHERVSRSLENDTDIREKNARAQLQEE